jgi:hypothetical protein
VVSGALILKTEIERRRTEETRNAYKPKKTQLDFTAEDTERAEKIAWE